MRRLQEEEQRESIPWLRVTGVKTARHQQWWRVVLFPPPKFFVHRPVQRVTVRRSLTHNVSRVTPLLRMPATADALKQAARDDLDSLLSALGCVVRLGERNLPVEARWALENELTEVLWRVAGALRRL